MAHGVPVLTHDVGANPEPPVRRAEVVPRFDGSAAVHAPVRPADDGDYRARLGREAREYALSEFTWAATGEKYLREYTASDAETSGVRDG